MRTDYSDISYLNGNLLQGDPDDTNYCDDGFLRIYLRYFDVGKRSFDTHETLMLCYEEYKCRIRSDLQQYLYWLVQYKNDTYPYQYINNIALMFHYRKKLANFYYAGNDFSDVSRVDDVDMHSFTRTVLSSNILWNMLDDLHVEYDCDDNPYDYDKIFNLSWLKNFLLDNAVIKIDVEREIKLHGDEIDNYG